MTSKRFPKITSFYLMTA